MMSHDHMTHISYLYLPCAITTQYVGLRLNIITAEELSASISCMFRAFKSTSSDNIRWWSIQHQMMDKPYKNNTMHVWPCWHYPCMFVCLFIHFQAPMLQYTCFRQTNSVSINSFNIWLTRVRVIILQEEKEFNIIKLLQAADLLRFWSVMAEEAIAKAKAIALKLSGTVLLMLHSFLRVYKLSVLRTV